MEIDRVKLLRSLKDLKELTRKNDEEIDIFLRLCDLTINDVKNILEFLTKKITDPLFTEEIGKLFPDLLLMIVTDFLADTNDLNNFELYRKKCVALSKLVKYNSDVLKYSYKYFVDKKEPFLTNDVIYTPKRKQQKSQHQTVTDLEITKCCLDLLRSDLSFYQDIWDWSKFLDIFLFKGCELQKFYSNNILGLLTNMTDSQMKILNKNIPVELQLENDKNFSFKTISNLESKDNQNIICNFKSDVVTNIEGVFLSIYDVENFQFYQTNDGNYEKIVKVDSTKVNLRSLALGVSSGKAVCLTGSVGSGKTTLVEYLARKTGRTSPKNQEIFNTLKKNSKKPLGNLNGDSMKQSRGKDSFKRKSEELDDDFDDLEVEQMAPKNGFLRIQLGDQTDSKMLLGQYRCTDVPGEFIWQPGVLTQAVLNGYWLLLEDLDSATQDVCTVLTNLLENNYLSVPGFRDSIKIEPGFQLFMTLRTQKSQNSSQHSAYSLLEKYLYTINIQSLSRNELSQIICENYPKLTTVALRIVDVFLTFSSGCHLNDENMDITKTSYSIPNSGRLVSTRDLLKLCRRSDPTFSVTSTECAYFVFQNAVDLFCSHLPEGSIKTNLIVSIGAKLGIIRSRCEFLSSDYRPDVEIGSGNIKIGRIELLKRSEETEDDKRKFDGEVVEICEKRRKINENTSVVSREIRRKSPIFSFTRLASCVLERIAVSVDQNEPILLVGETGVGKTSSVQYLAYQTYHKLVVVNMNNQSDVSDLLGGFKPVDLSFIIQPIRSEFELLFKKTFNAQKNEKFLNNISVCYNRGDFDILIKLMLTIVEKIFLRSEQESQRALRLNEKWRILQVKLLKLNSQIKNSMNVSFAFIPGSLVNCIKNGEWILLDEINLASTETLECLSTILEPDGSVVLLEKGDFVPIKRHPDFRIFACMNPSTDIGKKDLPIGIRNRFTEFFVDELTSEKDLQILVGDYLDNTGIQKGKVNNVVKLYKKLRQLAQLDLNDGLGNRPVYSLRTLCRALSICAKNLCGSVERNLYESFCLSFLTQLDPKSHSLVLNLIQSTMVSNVKAVLSQQIPKPLGEQINFEGYWIQQGPKEIQNCENYILTDNVKQNLRDLSRIVSIGKLPVLLQGPTSAGKTSLIEYVAKKSGNCCLRINNHEHTDLQEYIGTYTSDVTGKLAFQEGVLVQAMKNGYWIILDELNLAPSDILEALNRVLDDNRELFIPETQVVIKAHPNFMLFATQNPPGLYGGRKTLSRAFKNRFIELHFSEIPRNELEIILEKRCLIPKSYAQKMVKTMSELQANRKNTSKNNFTLRDLFRWGNRYTYADKSLLDDKLYDWNQHLIDEGYLVLSAKVRNTNEVEIIEESLYHFFRKKISLENLFSLQENTSMVTKEILEKLKNHKNYQNIVWTFDIRRMAVLTAKSIQFDEPVLLIGPTGCGKTTICQILADIAGTNLRILNCHMHTEGADFLGGLRPFRGGDDENDDNLNKQLFEWSDGPLIHSMQEGSMFLADEISLAEDSVLERLNCILEPERTVLLAEKGGINENSENFVIKASKGFQFLATMNPGGDFGKKELSPALRNRFTEIWCRPTDSKEELIKIAEHTFLTKFQPNENIFKISKIIVECVYFLKNRIEKFNFSIRDVLAWINYILINSDINELTTAEISKLSMIEGLYYGLETMFLDSLEMLPHETYAEIVKIRDDSLKFLEKQIRVNLNDKITISNLQSRKGTVVDVQNNKFGISPFYLELLSNKPSKKIDFMFSAPTTQKNLFRLLSALSLNKSILLEGPPGVGKTSLIENLSKAVGYEIVRINLCEHTDLADLFGTDLPADNKSLQINEDDDHSMTKTKLGSFVWRDGPLLSALKAKNTWILLDELNLAPQSVLEGLNAILDHRGEVYIPELNKTFKLGQQTRIFAAQNPLRQGGGRKGLPQSFLNRFTKVYLRKLERTDLLHVVNGIYEKFFVKITENFTEESNLTERMVIFSEKLENGITNLEFGYKGGPFEVNLRDILRWCDFLSNEKTGFIFNKNHENFQQILYEKMKLVYCQRMRTENDKKFIKNIFSEVFECNADLLDDKSTDISLFWTDDTVYMNDIVLKKDNLENCVKLNTNKKSPIVLSSQVEILKNLTECVIMEKPIIVCGPTDSGKTKSVDLLCSISNKFCNVDTIDDSVTGSFQQIDFNRHLEEIATSVKAIVYDHVKSFALESKLNGKVKMTVLLAAWEKYNGVSKTNKTFVNQSAMSEELILFKKRIQILEEIFVEIGKIQKTTKKQHNLSQLRKVLSTLSSIIKSSESLNTGGHFEWVDSKVVKSLKHGQFICLEHVNLCSSAVVDRLNPVFEPNGNLLMSEKGVTVDNEAEIVEKHENFRAFLTLDPKHGEISRAMRNRCIELSLVKEVYSENDLRQLVYENGVKEMFLIKIILRIHHRLCDLSEFSVFGVSNVLKFAFLVSQNRRMGVDDRKSIVMSAEEVYVNSSTVDLLGFGLNFYRNKLKNEIIEEVESFDVFENVFDYENVILKSDHLNCFSLIKLQAEPFLTAMRLLFNSELGDWKNVLSNLSTDYENVDVELDFDFLKYLIYFLYEISSYDDLNQRYLYMRNKIGKNNSDDEISLLLNLNEKIMKDVLRFKKEGNSNLPWNSKLFPRIRDSNTESNQLNLSSLIIARAILKEVKVSESTKLSQIDVLTFSKAVETKIIEDSVNLDLISYIHGFLSNFEQHLENILTEGSLIDVKSYVDLIRAFLWNNRLLKISQEKLFLKKSVNKNIVDSLQLHFKWMDKNCMKLIKRLFSYKENDKFVEFSNKITNFVEVNNHPLDLIRKNYVKNFTAFLPYYEQQQIEFHENIRKYSMETSITDNKIQMNYERFIEKIKNLMSEQITEIRENLLKNSIVVDDFSFINKNVADKFDDSNLNENLKNRIEIFLTKISEISEEETNQTTEIIEFENLSKINLELKDIKIPIELQPILQYFALKATNLLQTGNNQNYKINYDYFVNIKSINPEILKIVKLFENKKYHAAQELWTEIMKENEIEMIVKNLPFDFYRNYSSFLRNLTMKLNQFELNSLASNNKLLQNIEDEEFYSMNKMSLDLNLRGPILTNLSMDLLLDHRGDLRATGLGDLNSWKKTLSAVQGITWSNMGTLRKDMSFEQSGLSSSIEHSSKIIKEIDIVNKNCFGLENKNFIEFHEDFNILVEKLKRTTESVKLSIDSTHLIAIPSAELRESQSYFSSILKSILGSIELNLLAYMPLLDPVEKNRLKKLYTEEDVDHLTKLITTYDFMGIIMNYKSLGEELKTEFKNKIQELEIKKEKYSKKVALRPDICCYGNLVKDINHFLHTCCHPKSLGILIETIENSLNYQINIENLENNVSLTEIHIQTTNEVLKKIELWISNADRFENHILSKYSSFYRDFLSPIEYSLSMVRFGLTGLNHCLIRNRDLITKKITGIYYNLNENGVLGEIMENLIEFPCSKSVDLFTDPDCDSGHKANIYSILEKLENREIGYFSLLKSKLQQIQNTMTINTNLESNSFKDLESILMICNKIWQQQEENRIKKQVEEDSLYVSKTKCETENEEETNLREIKDIFPHFAEEDFGDFLQNDTLEQVIKIDHSKDKEKKKWEVINDEDYKLFCDTFIYLMETFSRSYYRKSQNRQLISLDYITPYKTKFNIFHSLLEKYKTCLTSRMDDVFYPGLSFMVGISQENLNELSLTDKSSVTYNFYKDSNIQEILQCTTVLNKIEIRVKVELEQWPDHAVLIDIMKVIKKIYTIPTSSPVVRFSTGFQILRQKVDEWNSVAHSKNNLRDLEIEVAEYIQKWTRLELNFWRDCLTQSFEKVRSKAYKYWFFIYNLIQEYLQESSTMSCDITDFSSIEKSFGENEPLKELTEEEKAATKTRKIKSIEIIKVLQQFIESSNYGEFGLRMKILKSFEFYLNHIENSKKRNNLISIIHNLHLYFNQFSAEIEETCKSMRTPIEKKLKEFVKIESYNKDLSYFSMKNNIAKVHRNLHKFLKEFEKLLKGKISSVFIYKSNAAVEFNFDNEKGKNLRFETKVKYYMVEVKNFLASLKLKDKFKVPAELDTTKLSLLPKIDKLFGTSRNIVKEAILHAEFPTLIYQLDTLLSEQIETAEYLRKLEVDRKQERPKQLQQSKQILTQKRKALADFYKSLATLGISYKTGLLEIALKTEMTDLKIDPFCVKTMISDQNHKKVDQNLVYLNENLENYYAKCIFKIKLLFNTLLIPNPDLGLQNMERIKGFSVDMYLLVQNQRKILSKSVKDLYDLRKKLEDISDLNECIPENNFNFIEHDHNLRIIKSSACKIRDLFEQYVLLFKTTPQEIDSKLAVLKTDSLTKNSRKYLEITKLVNQILEKTQILLKEIEKVREINFLQEKSIKNCQKKLDEIFDDFNVLQSEFLLNQEEYLIIGKPLFDLSEELSKNKIIKKSNEAIEEDSLDNELENIIHSILISMQNVYKKYSLVQKEFYEESKKETEVEKPIETSETAEGEEDEPETIRENHLKQKICEELNSDLQILNISKITQKLQNLLKVIKSSGNLKTIEKLTSLKPILEQYSLLGEYYLVQQFGAHKVSTKMLSIMLTIFIELGSKGFCVPPDLQQDEEGEQKQEGKGEGFGLEDGTGENDVSDRIESEDQLDDAKKPGDEKDEKEEDGDCKEEKGIDMSEDFDSKMQDLDKKEKDSDDESEKSDDDEDIDKQMGETEEGAEKLDDQIWGDEENKEEEEEEGEQNEEDGKGSNEADDQHNDLESKNEEKEGKEKEEGLDAAGDEPEKDKRKKEKDDINEMNDPEIDEDQINPYHNDLEEPPEAEPMNLDEMNLDDDGKDQEEDGADENPFDIDDMKDKMPDIIEDDEDENGEDENDENKDENKDGDADSSEDEEPEVGQKEKEDEDAPSETPPEEETNKEEELPKTAGELDEEQKEEEEKVEDPNKPDTEKPKDDDFHESKDKASKEDNVQVMPDDKNKGTPDQVQANENDSKKNDDLDAQDTGEDKDGTGQAENEDSKTGHQGIADKKETKSNKEKLEKQDKQEKRKQGNTDEERTLGETKQPEHKKLKTIDKMNEKDEQENGDEENEDKEEDAEEFQHVKDAKKSDKTTLDNATEEQSKKVQHDENEKSDDEAGDENPEELMDTTEEQNEEYDFEELNELDSEKTEQKSDKPARSDDKIKEKCETRENAEVEGENIVGANVPRGDDTTAHCTLDILLDSSLPQEPTTSEILEMRKKYEKERTSTKLCLPDHENFEMWQQISNKMLPNARELCEQLRLILEPTKCTRLKGDYRTGRRINMKKIIPYIASQFRKDKIWLRRTKPAQRDYKITIAIDDSKSMHHNNSKNLTLQAISLVSQALTLLESGKLSIVSFGESPQIILNHTDQFDGPKLVNCLNFDQTQSKIAELLDFVKTASSEDGSGGSDNGLFENLLLVLSDGRNIFSEGEQKVKNTVKLARLQRIFIVYIIIDNPENKHSILDIRVPSFSSDLKSITMNSYLDTFPFPYYVIVRDLGQLPIVLSEAMRQWFELVNSEI